MPIVKTKAIELFYESFGAEKSPTILLVMGLGAQRGRWNRGLCDDLVKQGYRVIRFDNRDVGQSTHCDTLPLPDLHALMIGNMNSPLPYTLDTLAEDCMGLLDALNIAQAHIVGASMGGAIAQIIAARHAQRTLSLTCIMASSGNPYLPPPTAAAATALMAPLPMQRDRASIVADAILRHKAIASPAYPIADDVLAALYGEEYDHGFYPAGVARQLAALIAHGDRRPLLKDIRCPVSVLHGKDDPLIPFACGEDIAKNIPQARLFAIEGMGHDFPDALNAVFAEAITTAAKGQ